MSDTALLRRLLSMTRWQGATHPAGTEHELLRALEDAHQAWCGWTSRGTAGARLADDAMLRHRMADRLIEITLARSCLASAARAPEDAGAQSLARAWVVRAARGLIGEL